MSSLCLVRSVSSGWLALNVTRRISISVGRMSVVFPYRVPTGRGRMVDTVESNQIGWRFNRLPTLVYFSARVTI